MFRVLGAIIGAVGRLFRGIGYIFVGRLDGFSKKLESNPTAVGANYRVIIRDKKGRIQEYMGAVATLVAQQEKKSAQVARLSKEVERLQNLKRGAAAKAKEQSADLKTQGQTPEQIKTDGIYMQCLASFNDFTSTLREKEARIAELEENIRDYGNRIKSHKIQLQSLQREIAGLKDEAADTVADMISAQEEKEINDCLAGVSEDGTAADLERLRDMRAQAKAAARVASEVAGTDTQRLEAEFEAAATATAANDEFDALVGLGLTDNEKIARVEDKLEQSKEATAE